MSFEPILIKILTLMKFVKLIIMMSLEPNLETNV